MSNYDCMKGWIVAKSPSSDDYVPFFVNVRGSDIVWDTEDLPDDLAQFAVNIGTIDNCKISYPVSSFQGKVNNWDVTVYSNGTYRATYNADIQKAFSLSGGKLISKITLPFRTKKDGLSFQTTLNSDKDIFITSLSSASPYASDDVITALNVILYNVVSNYSSDFATNSAYSSSYVNIMVTGTINL